MVYTLTDHRNDDKMFVTQVRLVVPWQSFEQGNPTENCEKKT